MSCRVCRLLFWRENGSARPLAEKRPILSIFGTESLISDFLIRFGIWYLNFLGLIIRLVFGLVFWQKF